MRDGLRRRLDALFARLRRIERRELSSLRRWLEQTSNLVRLSALLLVPLLVGAVIYVSDTTPLLSFLLYPPLASGTYTLFADPGGTYSSPVKFVAGLTLGALCGWFALELAARFLYHVPPDQLSIHAGSATLAIFFTAIVTWGFDMEEPAAFSTALLVLATDASKPAYVVTVAFSSTVVALAFVVWRNEFYEERARYLYRATSADDHVLVPMLGETAQVTAVFAARLAAAHEAGKVVLLHLVDRADVDAAEAALADEGEPLERDGGPTARRSAAEEQVAAGAVAELEAHRDRIETTVGVPCEVVVATDGADSAGAVLDVAAAANCDLVVTPYQQQRGGLSPFVADLFRSEFDVVAFRSVTGETRWRRVLVPVRRAGSVAHAMLDYAERLAGGVGTVSVATCIDTERERRRAERVLSDLVETVGARVETRVSRSTIEEFIARNGGHYDLVILGASTDRSAASRFVSPPTFERIEETATDVAIVHQG